MPERRDWLLLLVGLRTEGPDAALDPVRSQKGMFLLRQRGILDDTESYEFTPYHYGPYSFELRSDLEALV